MEMGFRAERVIAYEQLNCAAATPFTEANLIGCSHIVIVPEGQAVRWRDDGVDPTAAVGMPLAVGQTLIYTAAQMPRVRFIEQAVSAKLNITYYSGS